MIGKRGCEGSLWLSRRASRSAEKGFISEIYKIYMRSPKVRKYFGAFLERYRWFYLLVAQKQREAGDHQGAFRTLMLGQRKFINEPWIHLKLSEIYRDNCEVHAAYTHLKIADKLAPGYCTIRLATFETDHAMFVEGALTMGRILTLPPDTILRYLPLINRITTHYPQHRQALIAIQISFEKEFKLGF